MMLGSRCAIVYRAAKIDATARKTMQRRRKQRNGARNDATARKSTQRREKRPNGGRNKATTRETTQRGESMPFLAPLGMTPTAACLAMRENTCWSRGTPAKPDAAGADNRIRVTPICWACLGGTPPRRVRPDAVKGRCPPGFASPRQPILLFEADSARNSNRLARPSVWHAVSGTPLYQTISLDSRPPCHNRTPDLVRQGTGPCPTLSE